MGTVAEELLEKGKLEGIAEGRELGIAEGKSETVLRLVRLKFGETPRERVDQVRNAGSGQLDAWLDALITAKDLDEVFAAGSVR